LQCNPPARKTVTVVTRAKELMGQVSALPPATGYGAAVRMRHS
jgi:hypothetical protein